MSTYATGSDNYRAHRPLLAHIDGKFVELSESEAGRVRADLKADIVGLEELLRGTRESGAPPKRKPLANAITFALAS